MMFSNGCHLRVIVSRDCVVKGLMWAHDKHVFLLFTKRQILDRFIFKAFADDKISVTQMLKFDLGRVENIVEKEGNAGYHHFHLFPTMFSESFFFKVIKSHDNVGKS